MPLERLLVETDAPFLAPPPHRGKRNEPAFVVEVARTVASLRGTSVEEVAAAAVANYAGFFPARSTVPGLTNPCESVTLGPTVADSSFDIVSSVDMQEIKNAIGQAMKEITTRFDLKGTGSKSASRARSS